MQPTAIAQMLANSVNSPQGYPMGSVMEQAVNQYPYLKNANLAYTKSAPSQNKQGFLEFWPPGESGANENPRPQSLPMERPGVEVISDKTRPIDILGDYVSHYAVTHDPRLKDLYGQFKASVDPAELQKRYDWHRQNGGEQRPMSEWAEQSGYPEEFRGYTFDQWPADAVSKFYRPEQLKILDSVKSYLGIGQSQFHGLIGNLLNGMNPNAQ